VLLGRRTADLAVADAAEASSGSTADPRDGVRLVVTTMDAIAQDVVRS
jgi:hypothetical protein